MEVDRKTLLQLTYSSRKNDYHWLMFKKKFRKNIFKVLLAIKFKSFQRMLAHTLSYASKGEEECLSSIGNQ